VLQECVAIVCCNVVDSRTLLSLTLEVDLRYVVHCSSVLQECVAVVCCSGELAVVCCRSVLQ